MYQKKYNIIRLKISFQKIKKKIKKLKNPTKIKKLYIYLKKIDGKINNNQTPKNINVFIIEM